MRFSEICSLGVISLTEDTKAAIQSYSKNSARFFYDTVSDETEIVERIGRADCLLVNVRSPITRYILGKRPQVKYIGVCGTHPTLIDLEETHRRGIAVTTVDGYCDHETAEFVVAQLLMFARGLGNEQWKAKSCTLKGKSIGIVGLGRVGGRVAQMCKGLGMKVRYCSRSRRPELEERGIDPLPLGTLLGDSDIVSLHTPAFKKMLGREEINQLRRGSILINTCVGQPIDESALHDWLTDKENTLILDLAGAMFYPGLKELENVVVSSMAAYDTREARENLNRMVLNNLRSWCHNNQE